ncbi:MAG: hypothetical protein V4651_06305, partial [Bacteroidota bacterium]
MNEQMNSTPLNETETNREELNTDVTPEVTAETTGAATSESTTETTEAIVTENPVKETTHETMNADVTPEVTAETPVAIVTEDHVETIELTEEEKEMESIADDELPNFSTYTKEQLIETAVDAVKTKDLLEATRYIKAIKPVIDHLPQEEYNS